SGSTKAGTELRFAAVATGSPDPVHREFDLGLLGTGHWVLEVSIQTSAGVPVVRRREFTVVR
ncbi:MAG: hypothetical protein ABI369_10430, partial [Acetobacteraceae bacterium]